MEVTAFIALARPTQEWRAMENKDELVAVPRTYYLERNVSIILNLEAEPQRAQLLRVIYKRICPKSILVSQVLVEHVLDKAHDGCRRTRE